MRDPCRICGVRLVGSQCRWIFSSSAKRKLHVILSHVLGWEVTRDGRGEFLCGKCVFQLEKVVTCDVNISQLQDKHTSEIQRLQAEKEHLMQCIVHIYRKNNQQLEKGDSESASCKTVLGTSEVDSPEDEVVCHLASEIQQYRESGSGHTEIRIRRCVSLDRIVSKGALSARSSNRRSRIGSAAWLDGSMKSFGLRGTRHCSQSMYFDLVQRKGTLPRSGFKGRSASLQCLTRDSSFDAAPDPLPKFKLREPKTLVPKRNVSEDAGGKVQVRALLRRSSNQPSVISDLIQLLRCISRQQVSAPPGSHIPIMKSLNSGNPRVRRRLKEAEWKSLHDLSEEFDDQFTPIRVKVAFCLKNF